MNIKLFPVGKKRVCALVGPDVETGLAGFGSTPAEALRDLAQKIESYRFDLPEIEGDQARSKLKNREATVAVKPFGDRCRGRRRVALYGR